MIEIKLTDSDMEDLRNTFFSQSREILDNLPNYIMAIEERPDDESWKALKRAFHTLKGDSRAMGFESLSTFAHKVEDLIESIMGRDVDRAYIDLFLECIDAFELFLDKTARNESMDISDILSKIESCRSEDGEQVKKKESSKVKAKGIKEQTFIRIEPKRIDRIMNLIGELVIVRSTLEQITSAGVNMDKDSIVSNLEGVNLSFDRSLGDLQRSVMKVRMLPVEYVFRRFPRIVRDLSHAVGKKVRLFIKGEKTEIDKTVIDVIGEPLLHIIRNAVDHGIETAEQRKNVNKPEEGAVHLRAFHQGNQIVLEVEDDGKGIDVERLKERAVNRGILNREDAAKMSIKDATNLIFVSGFSTAEKITEMSGRGVGMDIVKEVVESLRGLIDINSEKNKGTKITLRLPLTLAIIKAILFKVSAGMFALPLTSVIEILRVRPEDVETIAGCPVLRHRESIIPLQSIGRPEINKKKLFVILIGVAQIRAGIVAEEILGEEDMVIKAIDESTSSKIAAGASILGDGSVVLILDPLHLIRRSLSGNDVETEFSWA